MKFEFISSVVPEQIDIPLPRRATTGSAGYDFFSPIEVSVSPNSTVLIPTNIKMQLDKGYVLEIYPRSSYGFKYGIMLANTVGIIDSDYYDNKDNEGHIFVKLRNLGDKTIEIKKGDAFCQGIIKKYYLVDNDSTNKERTGGIGSTNE